MAKVTMPLLSGSASGKIADAMVFFGWKGLAVVRQWVKPANPQTANQGDNRVYIGGVGKAVGKIQAEAAFANQLIALGLIPSGQTKQSFLVKYILTNYLTGTAAYLAELSAITNHAAYEAFTAAAAALTIVEFDLSYASVAPFDKALGLYLIAKASIALGFTTTPYSTAIGSWVTADVNGMVTDFTAA